MSITGKLLRGLKWWKFNRDLDGKLFKSVSDNVDKMIDVNFFLDYTTEENRDEVGKELMRFLMLARAPGGKRSKLYLALKEKFSKPWVSKKDKPAETKKKGKR